MSCPLSVSSALRAASMAPRLARRFLSPSRSLHMAAAAAAAPPPPPEEDPSLLFLPDLTPTSCVSFLDRHIVGQADAKRAMALALRNRWRRFRVLPKELRPEIYPKNMLMVGPTGVGKTEIARRVSKLTGGPFVKAELTKFTEVGYQGKDVDSIIEDLYREAKRHTKDRLKKKHEGAAKAAAVERVLDAMIGEISDRPTWRKLVLGGHCDNLELPLPAVTDPRMDLDAIAAWGSRVFEPPPGGNVTEQVKVGKLVPMLTELELERLLAHEDLDAVALRATQEEGIVFLDELDKVVSAPGKQRVAQASAEGVQQDLLPLVEGTVVTTKSGVNIATDHILFVAAGAFHTASVSDILPELQGRFPIRVPLTPLTEKDLLRILTEPKFNLLRQHQELLSTEGVTVEFADSAIRRIAQIAHKQNSQTQSIGARRLMTVVEAVMGQLSFDAPKMKGDTVVIDAAYVDEHAEELETPEDLDKEIF
eukprot:TRINITY_DN32643_c0_g1_i1.p1 TRINITY_DN32643_c0_g1~~TRINITY_DN32643_c0_g1_i1.p1  ORF type:complete len:478 (+),score=128.17 TRINITY_DN32643_c0_g1_i1:267-1700(+)